MPRHLEPQQLSPAAAQNQKHKQEFKAQWRNNAHIDSGNRLCVILQKGLPGLRRRFPTSHHVFGDCRLGNFEPEHQELAMNSGRAPQRILSTHPLDEITKATIDLRPPCPISGFPAPLSREVRAMPPQNRLRLNHPGQIDQVRPEPGYPYEQRPVTAAQPRPRPGPPQCDI